MHKANFLCPHCNFVFFFVRLVVTGATSSIVMMSTTADEAVSRYKNFVGNKKFEEMENAEQRATTCFNEICDVYGEENAIKMVRDFLQNVFLLSF